jgi:hypothetical protein
MRRMRVVWAALLAMMLLASASPVLAFDGEPPGVVVGEDFTLRDGEVLRDDLVVVGGDVVLEEGSRVDGGVVVWGGSLEVSGEVEGDIVVFGGSVHLTDTAEVDGNVASFGGEVERDPGADLGGQQIIGGPYGEFGRWPIPVPIPRAPVFFDAGPGMLAWRLAMGVGRVLLLTLLMAGLGGLVAVLWPRPARQVGKATARSVLPSLGMGLLTMLVTVIVVVGLVLTLCLSPLALVAALAVGIATLFGWLAFGIFIGEQIVRGDVNPFWPAALGAGLVTLLSSLVNLIPCVGWVVPFLVACVGLGAVVLTRFGTVPYPAPAVASPLPPAVPALEPTGLELEPEVEEETAGEREEEAVAGEEEASG